MEGLLKILSCFMLVVLLTLQLLLRTPFRQNLTDDSLNGRALKTYETLLYRGSVSLDTLGNYIPNSCDLLINGERYKTIDTFPIEFEVKDGDVVEIRLKKDVPAFYVFLSSREGQILTDMAESTIYIEPGIQRVFKVLMDNIER